MFKAIHKVTHQEIIALEPNWADPGQVDALRHLGRAEALICQGCKQPVRIKAGQVRIRHFAHKSLGTCTYGKEALALLMARALLYQRLRIAFGEAVTLEKQFEDKRFPRPVDCWLERDGVEPIAYWIVDARIRPQVRNVLREALAAAGARVHWIFIAPDMLRPFEERNDALLLSPIERDLATRTAFDKEALDGRFWHGESLHYLDSNAEALTTFRGLSCIHEPQVYQGRRFVSPLSEVLVAPRTGEFAHPGERERLASLEGERQRQEEERRRREEEEQSALLARLQTELVSRAASVKPSTFGKATIPAVTLLRPAPSAPKNAPTSYSLEDKEAVCVHCGERTRNWWTYHMGTCKCNACRKKGLY